MKYTSMIGMLLLAASGAAFAATKCPTIETAMVEKGFGHGPWQVVSGGQGDCSFMAADTSNNFGFSHTVSESPELATTSAGELRAAVVGTSVVVPLPSLGEEGIAYQMKDDKGAVNPGSVFFSGHRGRVTLSGYLNLKGAITPAQRDFAANLLAGTLGVATNAKALAKESDCPFFDDALVKKLLPTGSFSTAVPNKESCIVSADGRVITLSMIKDARSGQRAQGMMQGAGCQRESLPKFGEIAAILHHCSEGNPRAQVVVAREGRSLEISYIAGPEPSDEQRATLIELAAYALRH
jgi:hypothetical protein